MARPALPKLEVCADCPLSAVAQSAGRLEQADVARGVGRILRGLKNPDMVKAPDWISRDTMLADVAEHTDTMYACARSQMLGRCVGTGVIETVLPSKEFL